MVFDALWRPPTKIVFFTYFCQNLVETNHWKTIGFSRVSELRYKIINKSREPFSATLQKTLLFQWFLVHFGPGRFQKWWKNIGFSMILLRAVDKNVNTSSDFPSKTIGFPMFSGAFCRPPTKMNFFVHFLPESSRKTLKNHWFFKGFGIEVMEQYVYFFKPHEDVNIFNKSRPPICATLQKTLLFQWFSVHFGSGLSRDSLLWNFILFLYILRKWWKTIGFSMVLRCRKLCEMTSVGLEPATLRNWSQLH